MSPNNELKPLIHTETAQIFIIRTGIALLQALTLYLLNQASERPFTWPATTPEIYIPLELVSLYIPLLFLLGVGKIQCYMLGLWAFVAALIIYGLGYHAAVRGYIPSSGIQDALHPWCQLYVAISVTLFIGHVLVTDSILERRLSPPYSRHFDTAWEQGIQTVLTIVFAGSFWGVLNLGANLFKLLDIDLLQRLIKHDWFYYPATTLAIAVSIHVTDAQPSLIRGIRTVVLSLLSWLLPLLTIILAGFLCSLPFISLAHLWSTHFATGSLLLASSLIIFLLNSVYQDCGAEQTASWIKRIAESIAAIELPPLIGLATWALSLRIEQYGWSVDRIFAASIIFLMACHAIGYAYAVICRSSRLKRIEMTNVIAAYLSIGLIILLFSPVADPARLMVADQMSRLTSGKTPADQFDFISLKYDGAGWGKDALTKLSQMQEGPQAAKIAVKARQVLAMTKRYSIPPNTSTNLDDRVTVFPNGRTLPADIFDLVSGPFSKSAIPLCLQLQNKKCTAYFVTLHQGETESIVIMDLTQGFVLQQSTDKHWHQVGNLIGSIYCPTIHQKLEQGEYTLQEHAWPDLIVGGQTIFLLPTQQPCP